MNSAPVEPAATRIAQQYFECEGAINVTSIHPSGGYSGAQLWRIATTSTEFCLRRWPAEHPSRERLAYIHRVLHHVANRGVGPLAIPIKDRHGDSFIENQGVFWELSRWLPGKADFKENPSPARLVDAMRVLARFHLATDTLDAPSITAPPGIVARLKQLRDLLQGGLDVLRRSSNVGDWPRLQQQAEQIFGLFPRISRKIALALESATRLAVRRQACIRDIWHDHILFDGDRVSGIVDFGAMRPDHVAGDIARLLGSLVADDRDAWNRGLAAYQSHRPLSGPERELVTVYDHSGQLLGAINWLQWIFVEGRQFDDRQQVNARLDDFIARLQRLIAE